ncbi:MAG: M13 family peptidase, partial [Terriglobia bacterium]
MRLRLLLPILLIPSAAWAASVDTGAMNTAVDPCVDFYQYACGNWIAKNPLPADRSRWARFTELSERTERVLLDLVKEAAAPAPGRSERDQKIGDYFASCMDTATIARKGLESVAPELNSIREMASASDLVSEVARLHRRGVSVLFGFSSRPDAKDSSRTIAALNQGGLSLPDRDYYLKTDAKSIET